MITEFCNHCHKPSVVQSAPGLCRTQRHGFQYSYIPLLGGSSLACLPLLRVVLQQGYTVQRKMYQCAYLILFIRVHRTG